jgi:hypothetical protein
VEDQETLEGRAVVLERSAMLNRGISLPYQNATDLVQCAIQDLLANCVVASRIIVGCVLLTADQQLGVEQLAVVTSADLVDWRRVEVDEDGTRDIFAAASLREDGIKLAGVVEGLRVRIRATILLQAVFEEISCSSQS